MKSALKGLDDVEVSTSEEFSDPLSQLSQGASHFKGCWRNLHGLEFPSARRYSVLHAEPSDFTDAGTHEAICYPTFLTFVCQRTMQYVGRNNKVSLVFISSLAKGDFSLTSVKNYKKQLLSGKLQ